MSVFNYTPFSEEYVEIPGREEEFAPLKNLFKHETPTTRAYPFGYEHNPIVDLGKNEQTLERLDLYCKMRYPDPVRPETDSGDTDFEKTQKKLQYEKEIRDVQIKREELEERKKREKADAQKRLCACRKAIRDASKRTVEEGGKENDIELRVQCCCPHYEVVKETCWNKRRGLACPNNRKNGSGIGVCSPFDDSKGKNQCAWLFQQFCSYEMKLDYMEHMKKAPLDNVKENEKNKLLKDFYEQLTDLRVRVRLEIANNIHLYNKYKRAVQGLQNTGRGQTSPPRTTTTMTQRMEQQEDQQQNEIHRNMEMLQDRMRTKKRLESERERQATEDIEQKKAKARKCADDKKQANVRLLLLKAQSPWPWSISKHQKKTMVAETELLQAKESLKVANREVNRTQVSEKMIRKEAEKELKEMEEQYEELKKGLTPLTVDEINRSFKQKLSFKNGVGGGDDDNDDDDDNKSSASGYTSGGSYYSGDEVDCFVEMSDDLQRLSKKRHEEKVRSMNADLRKLRVDLQERETQIEVLKNEKNEKEYECASLKIEKYEFEKECIEKMEKVEKECIEKKENVEKEYKEKMEKKEKEYKKEMEKMKKDCEEAKSNCITTMKRLQDLQEKQKEIEKRKEKKSVSFEDVEEVKKMNEELETKVTELKKEIENWEKKNESISRLYNSLNEHLEEEREKHEAKVTEMRRDYGIVVAELIFIGRLLSGFFDNLQTQVVEELGSDKLRELRENAVKMSNCEEDYGRFLIRKYRMVYKFSPNNILKLDDIIKTEVDELLKIS